DARGEAGSRQHHRLDWTVLLEGHGDLFTVGQIHGLDKQRPYPRVAGPGMIENNHQLGADIEAEDLAPVDRLALRPVWSAVLDALAAELQAGGVDIWAQTDEQSQKCDGYKKALDVQEHACVVYSDQRLPAVLGQPCECCR